MPTTVTMPRRPRRQRLWRLAVAVWTITLLLAPCASASAVADPDPAAVTVKTVVPEPRVRTAAGRWAHRGLFLATETALLIDLGQTLDLKRHPGFEERGGLRAWAGAHPRDEAIVAYFASGMVLYALAYTYLPPRWSAPLLAGQFALSLSMIEGNRAVGMHVRF